MNKNYNISLDKYNTLRHSLTSWFFSELKLDFKCSTLSINENKGSSSINYYVYVRQRGFLTNPKLNVRLWVNNSTSSCAAGNDESWLNVGNCGAGLRKYTFWMYVAH